MKNTWISERILNSRAWNWVKILGAIIGLLTGIMAIVNYCTDNWILDSILPSSKPTFTIEQTVSPETLKKAKEQGSTIILDKSFTIYPEAKK